MQAMEERGLFLLLLLRQPHLRMIYVTSMPISEAIVEYYLGLLPGVIPSHARSRLTLVPVRRRVPLVTQLEDPGSAPAARATIRSLIVNPSRSHLIPYNTTALERDVAISLGIPMYGADPRLADLGSKTGCRRTFEELAVLCPVGAEDLHTVDDMVARPCKGCAPDDRSLAQVIVKLNEGVSGSGNALVDLHDLPASGAPERGGRRSDRTASPMQLEADEPGSGCVPRAVREGRRHHRGTDHRDRPHQSERPDARAARRHRRAALHPRSAARRWERSDATSAACFRRIPTTRSRSVSRRW